MCERFASRWPGSGAGEVPRQESGSGSPLEGADGLGPSRGEGKLVIHGQEARSGARCRSHQPPQATPVPAPKFT